MTFLTHDQHPFLWPRLVCVPMHIIYDFYIIALHHLISIPRGTLIPSGIKKLSGEATVPSGVAINIIITNRSVGNRQMA